MGVFSESKAVRSMSARPARVSVQQGLALSAAAALALALFAITPSRELFHFGREIVAVPIHDDNAQLLFVRESIGVFSPEYRQKLTLMREGRRIAEFMLPEDTGGFGKLLVAGNARQPAFVIFLNPLGEFLVNVDTGLAYRVFHCARNEYLPQYCSYAPGFPGMIDPVFTLAELERLEKMGFKTNSPLMNLCVDSWIPTCVIDGDPLPKS